MPLPPTIQSLTLDDAILRSHRSMSNIFSALASYSTNSLQKESDLDLDTSAAPLPSKSRSTLSMSKLRDTIDLHPEGDDRQQLGVSTSSNASTSVSNHEYGSGPMPRSDSESTLATGISNNSSSSSLLRVRLGHGMMKKSLRDLRAGRLAGITSEEGSGGGERISFLDWSPPSSQYSDSEDDEEEDALSISGNVLPVSYGQSSSQASSSDPSPTAPPGHTPASPPLQLPSSQLSPSFWLVADPNANPLARRGAKDTLPAEEDEASLVDVVIIGSGITGVSFLMKFVEGWMKDANIVDGEGKTIRIVMLEARDFCSGATGRNGGHLTPSIFDDFTERSSYQMPSSTTPIDDAIRCSLLEQHTLSSIASLVETNSWAKDIDYVERGHVPLLGIEDSEEGKTEAEQYRKDYDAAVAAGLPESIIGKVRWMDSKEMQERYGTTGVPEGSGCWYPAANVWPLKLVTKMFEKVEETVKDTGVEVKLYTHTPVQSVTAASSSSSSETGRPTWAAKTSRGTIRSRYVIHATNAYASHLLPQFSPPSAPSTSSPPTHPTQLTPTSDASPPHPDALKPRAQWIQPTRGQVLATRAASKGPDELWGPPYPGPSWRANRGYEYWFPRYWFPRPSSPSAEKEKALIILGGARDEAGPPAEGGGPLDTGIVDDSTINPRISKALRSFLPDVYPDLFERGQEPEYEWTGIMGYTKTLDPIVGPVPLTVSSTSPTYVPGQFVSAGYSGHGMPRAYACAEALASMVLADMRAGERDVDWAAWKEARPDWLPESYLTI